MNYYPNLILFILVVATTNNLSSLKNSLQLSAPKNLKALLIFLNQTIKLTNYKFFE